MTRGTRKLLLWLGLLVTVVAVLLASCYVLTLLIGSGGTPFSISQDCSRLESRVRVTVVGPDSAPVAGAQVSVTDVSGTAEFDTVSGETNPNGYFDTDWLGTFACSVIRLEISADGYETYSVQNAVSLETSARRRIVLTPSGS